MNKNRLIYSLLIASLIYETINIFINICTLIMQKVFFPESAIDILKPAQSSIIGYAVLCLGIIGIVVYLRKNVADRDEISFNSNLYTIGIIIILQLITLIVTFGLNAISTFMLWDVTTYNEAFMSSWLIPVIVRSLFIGASFVGTYFITKYKREEGKRKINNNRLMYAFFIVTLILSMLNFLQRIVAVIASKAFLDENIFNALSMMKPMVIIYSIISVLYIGILIYLSKHADDIREVSFRDNLNSIGIIMVVILISTFVSFTVASVTNIMDLVLLYEDVDRIKFSMIPIIVRSVFIVVGIVGAIIMIRHKSDMEDVR